MGNEYGVSPLTILQILGPLSIIAPVMIWFLVIGPGLIYPLARWRATRDGITDPQLGLKVALHWFALIAFQVVLFAAALIIFTVLSKDQEKGSNYRTGFAFLLPAGMVLGGHLALLHRTNQEQFPAVRRLFLGYNLIITGLLGFAALLLVFQVFFRKGSAGDDGRFAIAAALVYVGAWAACGIHFGRLVFAEGDAAAAPPHKMAPPSAPSPPTQTSGPTLPSLSTGSFPPLDTK